MKKRTSIFEVLTMVHVTVVSLLLAWSARGGPHQWLSWTQGILREVDSTHCCLTLESGKTNCLIRWSKETRQWQGDKDPAPNGHPLTPNRWSTGQLVRVLTENKGKTTMARRIILPDAQTKFSYFKSGD